VADVRRRIRVIDRRGDKKRLRHFGVTNLRTNDCRASALLAPFPITLLMDAVWEPRLVEPQQIHSQ
jgi:hypothetical protein